MFRFETPPLVQVIFWVVPDFQTSLPFGDIMLNPVIENNESLTSFKLGLPESEILMRQDAETVLGTSQS